MNQSSKTQPTAEFQITNIGGIDESSTTLQPGVNILTGKNATNRTSFLQAIMAACGSEQATLKADADQGEVFLKIGDKEYTRTLTRQNQSLLYQGNPYLDDSILADLFAFLLENNEARQAVARGDNLREILMRPVNTAEIKREIDQLQAERDDVETQLQRLDSLDDELPSLRKEQQQFNEEIADMEAELAEKQTQIEALDLTVEEKREEKENYEDRIDELSQQRQEDQRLQRRLESERESIDSLKTDYERLSEELTEYDRVPDRQITQIDQKIQRLRGKIQQIDSTAGDLQSVIKFNEEFLEEGQPEFFGEVEGEDRTSDGDSAQKTVEDSNEVACWTCGSTVKTTQIASTLDRLRTVRNEQMDERGTLQNRIDELRDEQSALESQQRNREQTERQLAEVEAEIDDREATVDDLKEQRATVQAEIERLESAVGDHEDVEESEILALQKETSRIEVEIEQLTAELNDVEERIADIESELENRNRLEPQREEIKTELDVLRTKIEDLQTEAVDEFNSHMDAVLDRLNYENLERIWIERTEEEVREGRRKVTKDQFELHVVRSTESGMVYEDIVDHLSESEREITGLVFALAGYLVHEVYDQVPFMLLDSIEAVDSDRIARLVDYLSGYSDYLVVALLEEDAQALNDSYRRIESM